MTPNQFLKTIWICEPPKGSIDVPNVEQAMKLYAEHIVNSRPFGSISQQFKDWWNKYDDIEKVKLIAEKTRRLKAYQIKKENALKAEMAHGFKRVGIRGGKFTTLNAKAQNSTRMYLLCMDELKYMVATL